MEVRGVNLVKGRVKSAGMGLGVSPGLLGGHWGSFTLTPEGSPAGPRLSLSGCVILVRRPAPGGGKREQQRGLWVQ